MPGIIGAHHISRGNHGLAPGIAKQILDGKQLLCAFGTHAYGAYAYYADRIPKRHNKAPFVVFQIASSRIKPCLGFGGLEYFIIPERDHTKLYVPIDILGYVNIQGFVSCPVHLYNFK
jgi:hypothetical protein